MARWHVNPKTGDPGRCSAKISCPYGSMIDGHKATKEEASRIFEKFQATVSQPDGAAHFYFVSDEAHEQFTQGECGDLAAELHRLTDYPIVALGSQWDEHSILWDHIAVRVPDGRILDVTGIQPENEAMLAWNYDPKRFRIGVISVDEINSSLGLSKSDPAPGGKDAEKIAKQILEVLKS